MNSLRTRMVAVASLVLAAFLGVTGVALERAFHDTGLELVRERLQAQVYGLLAAAEPGPGNAFSLDGLPEPRFTIPDSGLYAAVKDAGGGTLWRSRSLLDRDLGLPPPAGPGEPRFSAAPAPWGEALFALSYRVRWELPGGGERVFDLHVAESRREFDARVARFRRDLWTWLAVLAVGLLLAQAVVLTRGLAPLERLARELRAIEAGKRDALSEDQPQELRALAANMNHLIRFGRRALERHRNALADLAHALKTPLAVLRGAAEDAGTSDAGLARTVLEAVARMDESLSYRLRRASAVGEPTLGAPVTVAPLAARLVATLSKVYADKGLVLDTAVPERLQVRADAGDLTEILGNLMDNACKWARTSVRLAIAAGPGGQGLEILVDDDGPGIPPGERARILERGVRADERMPGQGIGLSLVRELAVDHYGGAVRVEDSPAGGARLRVRLDVRST